MFYLSIESISRFLLIGREPERWTDTQSVGIRSVAGYWQSGVPGFFSCSRSRSGTMTGLSATELVLAIMTPAPII